MTHPNYDFVKDITAAVLDQGVRKPPQIENKGSSGLRFTFYNVTRHKGEDYYKNYVIGNHEITVCLSKDDADADKVHCVNLSGIPKEVKTDFFFNQSSDSAYVTDFNNMVEPTVSMMFSGKFNKEYNNIPQFIYFIKVTNSSSFTTSIEVLGFAVTSYEVFDQNAFPNINARCFFNFSCVGESNIITAIKEVYNHRSLEDYKTMDYGKYVRKYCSSSPQFKTDINILKAVITKLFISKANKEIENDIRYSDNGVYSVHIS